MGKFASLFPLIPLAGGAAAIFGALARLAGGILADTTGGLDGRLTFPDEPTRRAPCARASPMTPVPLQAYRACFPLSSP